jgi:hypothetical protein
LFHGLFPTVAWSRDIVFTDITPRKNEWNKNDAQENWEELVGGVGVDAVRKPEWEPDRENP